jgi:glycosyltransferase involved in cell wall biosynthesis
MHKFSIVTPTYNHKKYIETTIKSVIANKSDNYEVEYIVVDGNSNDGTQDVVNEYIEHVDKFISENDDGQADAINKGFTHASGDIYAYINSDDYYYPEAFEKVAKIFKENPRIDVIYGNCLFVTEAGQFFRYFTEVEPFDGYRLTSCTDFIMQPACFWRKDIYEKCDGFTKDFHFGFDWEMWCRMLKHGAKFHYEPQLLAVNREFKETKTSTGGDTRLAELKQINVLHAQSPLPYAYYSYKQGELRTNYSSLNSFYEKIISILKIFFYRLLSFKNIMYSNKNFEKQALYGLAHHSSILEKNASISIPYYKDSKKIYLLLVLETHLKNQSVTININGTDVVNSLFSYNRVVLIYKIKNIENNIINIKLNFDKEITKALGIRNKLLGRKTKYSATRSVCHFTDNSDIINKSLPDAYYLYL